MRLSKQNVIPAEAGISLLYKNLDIWDIKEIPAFAGMTLL